MVRLKNVHRLAKRWGVGTKENPLSDPSAENSFVAPANEMKKPTPGIADATMNHVCQVRIVGHTDVLQHAH
jgi:hypothetical protein